jgi:hypothetical protein
MIKQDLLALIRMLLIPRTLSFLALKMTLGNSWNGWKESFLKWKQMEKLQLLLAMCLLPKMILAMTGVSGIEP